MNAASNRQLVERYWITHFQRNWIQMETFFAAECHYTDVGVDPVGATGPPQIVERLRLGLGPLSAYYRFPEHMIAEGDLVVTEHTERWQFESGEVIDHPSMSTMEVRDGLIVRWRSYSHFGNLLGRAPTWWLEHVRVGWRLDQPITLA